MWFYRGEDEGENTGKVYKAVASGKKYVFGQRTSGAATCHLPSVRTGLLKQFNVLLIAVKMPGAAAEILQTGAIPHRGLWGPYRRLPKKQGGLPHLLLPERSEGRKDNKGITAKKVIYC